MAVCWLLFAALVFVEQGIALGSNGTVSEEKCKLNTKCVDGIVLPMWGQSDKDVSVGIRVARAFVYLVLLMYFFLGVSIIADRFMAAIEIITSKEKDITVTDKKTGKLRVLTVKIWNETVSNLTLMALGSSAPEILLTVIEVCGKNFEAGELGPSTIVGSAAFNLFVIIAICVYSIPCDDHRQIKHLQVFAVTATCSLFAYVWLYIIVAVNTANVITVWEGLLTFAFFPLLVLFAWMADRKFNFYRFLRKRVRRQKRQGVVVVQTGDYDVVAIKTKDGYGRSAELDGKTFDMENGDVGLEPDEEEELLSHDLTEERRLKAMQVIRDIRQKNPNADKETIERILEKENLKAQPKSRAFYRIEATRKMVGSGSVLKAKHDKLEQAAAHSIGDVDVEMNELLELEKQHITRVQFDPPHYTCIESCGSTLITVLRAGGDESDTVYVDFKTEDGTAKSGEDYEKTEGTLCFKPGETVKTISLTVIDDDIFEEDEHFTVRLSNIRVAGPDGKVENFSGAAGVLGKNSVAEVVILDDDYPGVFSFHEKTKSVAEADRRVVLEVFRHQGARGIVRVPYHTMEGTAKGGGEAFEDSIGELEFGNEEYNKQIEIVIVDDEDYEKKETFQVYLGQPYVVTEEGEEPPPSPLGSTAEEERIRELGKPCLGEISSVEVSIIESKEFKNTVDRLLAKANLALVVGTSSWREQFVDAFTVGSDDADEESESVEPSPPTYGDYLMHYLTLFWKVLFATVPPTDIWSGWACFTVSIVWIGILTMFIGDLASHFGCTIGLSDSVVAISFVALGTSVPDTFASKTAAINDEYADSSIGNVTGSNSVNVFLGVGLAWSLAAIVHAIRGTEFRVQAGSLGFSVVVFCIFAVIAICVLMLRRHPAVGGVLGGPMKFKLPTTIFLVFLWIMYIVLSSLEAYCHFEAF